MKNSLNTKLREFKWFAGIYLYPDFSLECRLSRRDGWWSMQSNFHAEPFMTDLAFYLACFLFISHYTASPFMGHFAACAG